MIVVDLGTWAHYDLNNDSVTALVQRFHPELLWGFDPLVENEGACFLGETLVVTRAMAAWIADGTVPFKVAGTGSAITKSIHSVPCFDLANWLQTLPEPIVLKMDVEGAELALCRRLKQTGVDRRLERLIVETHGEITLPALACPVEEWWM